MELALHLRLSTRKTFLLPIRFRTDLLASKRRIAETCPFWQSVVVALKAKYFGIPIGEALDLEDRWAPTLTKFV